MCHISPQHKVSILNLCSLMASS
ncbi:UNVERIFIED_CONTAM: hypothetical protein GTU68_000891 [Idotea baltica]|nr:hypothetical protein [Idotea baltica]